MLNNLRKYGSILIILLVGGINSEASPYSDSLIVEIETNNNNIAPLKELCEYYLFQSINDVAEYAAMLRVSAKVHNDLASSAEAEKIFGDLYYAQGKLDSAIVCYDRGMNIYRSIGMLDKEAELFLVKGSFLTSIGEYSAGLSIIRQGLNYFKTNKNKYGEGLAFRKLALLYKILFDNETAYNYINKSIRIFKSINDSLNLTDSYILKSLIDIESKNFRNSLNNLDKAEQVSKKTFYNNPLIRILRYRGQCYLDSGLVEKGVGYFLQAIEKSKINESNEFVGSIYTLLSHCYSELGNHNLELEHGFLALRAREQLGDSIMMCSSYNNIGTTYNILEKTDSAKIYFYKSLSLAHSLNNQHYLNSIYKHLYLTFDNENKYDSALVYFKKYITIEDSIRLIKSNKVFQRTALELDAELQDKEHTILAKEKEIQFTIFITIAIFLLFVFIFLLSRYLVKRKAKQDLEYIVDRRTKELRQTSKELNQEITVRAKTEKDLIESETELSSLFKVMKDIVIVIDNKMTYLKIAPTSQRLLYKFADEIIGKKISDVFSKEQTQTFTEAVNKALSLQEVVNITYPLNIEGKDHWYNALIAPFDKDKIVFVARDITDLKNAEKGIKTLNSELEDNVKERTEKLETAMSTLLKEIQVRKDIEINLRSTNATKNKFFSIIAHDLKNPFQVLLNSSYLLSAEKNSHNIDKISKHSIQLNNAVSHITVLLENLLTWARTQTDKIDCKPKQIYLKEFFRNSIELSKISAEKKNIALTADFSDQDYVYADLNMLGFIIRNLISNAIKFTLAGGEIHCSGRTVGNEIEINITDSGVGIPENKINNLFRIDQRVSTNGTEEEKGTGLGLIICKEFVDQNKGQISVKSIERQGSTFSVRLPRTHPVQSTNR
ncbi:MAG: PAS domain-containing protein [Chlorobi bacterium]|nr:PAS domain-containing protein [Chlorobiota bacterium]